MLEITMHYNQRRVEVVPMRLDQRKSLFLALLPMLIGILIMLPRLASPQFGVMDDGLIYVESQKILQGDFSMRYDLQAGRFRPLYWLYFTLIYQLAGPNPFWFFLGHLVILLVLLVEIRVLMKYQEAKDWQVLLASLVFVFSIPIIENFYTLSKGDPLSLVFLLGALLCLEKLKRSTGKGGRWLLMVLAFANGLFAIWVKETAYIMAPVSACWAGYLLLKRKKFPAWTIKAFLFFFFSMAASMAAFFLLRAIFGAPPVTGGSFTERYDFSWQSLMERIPRWVTLFTSYYHYLLPILAMLVIILVVKRDIDKTQNLHFFTWGIWLLAWVAALLPWEFARAYYLLAFSLGVAILTGLLAPFILELIRNSTVKIRWVMVTLSALSAILFLASLTHYRTHAKAQLMFDRVNHQMLEAAVKIIPIEGRVFSSFEEIVEYVEGIEYFLVDFYGLSGIDYTHINVQTLERLHWYPGGIVLMPYVNNMPSLLVRAGVDEEFTMLWNEIILRNQGNRLIPLVELREEFRVINLNLPVIFCPLVGPRGYCQNPDSFFDTRLFSYGWDIYQIQ
jgi:hypothetical protein